MPIGRPYTTGAHPTAFFNLHTSPESVKDLHILFGAGKSSSELLLNRFFMHSILSLSISRSVTSHRLPKTHGAPPSKYEITVPLGS